MASLRLRLRALRLKVGRGRECPIQHFVLSQALGVQEGLQGSFAITVFAGMRPLRIVLFQPVIEVALQFIQAPVKFLAKSSAVKLLLDGAMKALTDALGLRRFRLGAVNGYKAGAVATSRLDWQF